MVHNRFAQLDADLTQSMTHLQSTDQRKRVCYRIIDERHRGMVRRSRGF